MPDSQSVPLLMSYPHRNEQPWEPDRIAIELARHDRDWFSEFPRHWHLIHMPAGWMGAADDPDDDPGDRMTGAQWWTMSTAHRQAYTRLAPTLQAEHWGVYAGVSGTSPYTLDVLGDTPEAQYEDSMEYPHDVPCFLATILPWKSLGASIWILDHGNATDTIWAGAEGLCYVAGRHDVYCGVESVAWRPVGGPQHSRVWTVANNRLFTRLYDEQPAGWPQAPTGCPAYVVAHRTTDGWMPNSKEVRVRLLKLLSLGWHIGGDYRYREDVAWALEQYSS